MSSYYQTSRALFIGAIIFAAFVVSMISYWIATGQDAIFGGRVIYDNAKVDCTSLKSYLLEYYGSNYYDEAKERYGVMCQ